MTKWCECMSCRIKGELGDAEMPFEEDERGAHGVICNMCGGGDVSVDTDEEEEVEEVEE